MRYQERIYIQNNNDAVRNKDILSFNMSSDMSIFEGPLFNVSVPLKSIVLVLLVHMLYQQVLQYH
jgi:hypothetical protein